MKGLGVSLAVGMIVVIAILFVYWLRTPYAISAQWDHSLNRGLETEDMMGTRRLVEAWWGTSGG